MTEKIRINDSTVIIVEQNNGVVVAGGPKPDTASDKLAARKKAIDLANYDGAIKLSREAIRLAQESGDSDLERKARIAAIRDLDTLIVGNRGESHYAREKMLRETDEHIRALDLLGESHTVVDLMWAGLARLRSDAQTAANLSKKSMEEAGTDTLTYGEALVIHLQSLWQLDRAAEAAELEEAVKSCLSSTTEAGLKLPLAATWIRTRLKSGFSSFSDVEDFIEICRDVAEKKEKSTAYVLIIMSDVADEFTRCGVAEAALELSQEMYRLGDQNLDEPWRMGSIALKIAWGKHLAKQWHDVRRYLAEAERWFEITRQQDRADPVHASRWIAGMANALKAKAELFGRWGHDDSTSDAEALLLFDEAYSAVETALALVGDHGIGAPGDLDLFIGSTQYHMGLLALDLGSLTKAAGHFRLARRDAYLADEEYRNQFGHRAAIGEAQALAFSGKVTEARRILTAVLAAPGLRPKSREMAGRNLGWLDEHAVPMIEWFRDTPAEGIGRSVARTGLREVVAEQVRPLIDWFDALPPRGDQHTFSELIDIWGRGGLARIAAAVRNDPLNAVVVDAQSIGEIVRFARMFCPLYDTVIVSWKGPLIASCAMVPMPDHLGPPGDFGGQGYMRTDTAAAVDGWHVAMGWANFFPKDVGAFLGTEALPLIRSGRLVVVPAPLVGCTQSVVGWTDNLFVDGLLGGVVKTAGGLNTGDSSRSGHRVNDLTKVAIPFMDRVPLAELDRVLTDTSEWLLPLRRLLAGSLGSGHLRQERWDGLGWSFTEIREACRRLEEQWKSLTRSRAGEDWAMGELVGSISAGERQDDTPGKDPLSDLLKSVSGAHSDLGPWIPFWRLQRAGGEIYWSAPFDNRSPPPDFMAQIHGVRSSISGGWLFPGDGGPGMATGFAIT